jgi:ABC-type transporter Mla maintaining outer membrane lipid asymmetry ATPase subunit MlaF
MLNKEYKASGSTNTPPIQVQSLSKSFGKQTVLKGINLEVAQGETISVLGRSGTGKSVLLKLIIGLHKPDSGSIRVHGEEVTSLPLKQLNEVRKKVGFLFQQAALYDSLTVEENVAFPLRRHSKMPKTGKASACRNFSRALEWIKTRIRCPQKFRAECKSASGWHGPWLLSLTSCYSMSQRLASIQSPPRRLTI